MLENLKRLNPALHLYSVHDNEFLKYGNITANTDTSEIISEAEKILIENDKCIYEPSVEKLEKTKLHKYIMNEIFGCMPVQTGCCRGRNSVLGALEYHKASEINIAVTDFVLMLGRVEEIKNGKYNSENIKAFYVQKGDIIEIFASTLHFCPCEVTDGGFFCIVVLPKGTNTVIEGYIPSDKTLFKRNKWLIAHEENIELTKNGVKAAIFGENYTLNKE